MISLLRGRLLALDREFQEYAGGRYQQRVGLGVTVADLPAPVASHPSAMVREIAGSFIEQMGRVAIVSMRGLIVQRPDLWTRYGYDTSATQFAEVNELLIGDPSVGSIVWDIDSPGGTVAGVPEAFERLIALRGQGKKIIAVANAMMASAAYWLGCAADQVVASPSAIVGSIGVYQIHFDHSDQNKQIGVLPTYITAGRLKVATNDDSPLTDDGRSVLQDRVDASYTQFVRAVATARGATLDDVRNGYGSGAVLAAKAAFAEKLVDRVGDMGSVLKSLRVKPATDAMAIAIAMQRQAEAE